MDRQEINRALAKAIAFKNCGKPASWLKCWSAPRSWLS